PHLLLSCALSTQWAAHRAKRTPRSTTSTAACNRRTYRPRQRRSGGARWPRTLRALRSCASACHRPSYKGTTCRRGLRASARCTPRRGRRTVTTVTARLTTTVATRTPRNRARFTAEPARGYATVLSSCGRALSYCACRKNTRSATVTDVSQLLSYYGSVARGTRRRRGQWFPRRPV
ncbi:hypothetical protein EXIGLDRAFT_830545, partial [Exidia glandulosa HHB12029]